MDLDEKQTFSFIWKYLCWIYSTKGSIEHDWAEWELWDWRICWTERGVIDEMCWLKGEEIEVEAMFQKNNQFGTTTEI